jgi:hypothetical protein
MLSGLRNPLLFSEVAKIGVVEVEGTDQSGEVGVSKSVLLESRTITFQAGN